MRDLFVWLAAMQQQPPPPPIIVKIIEPPHDPTGIADVLIGAIGLSGALALGAVLVGLVVGVILFFVRSRQPLS